MESQQQPAPDEADVLRAALRERLQEQSEVPPLPRPWYTESAMIPAQGFEFGGDFYVADLTDGVLQMVLVDTCGHGPTAVPDAVQFAGALQALVATLPPQDVMDAANHYVFDSGNVTGFATAAQLTLELATGIYRIRSAGHPPIMRWSAVGAEWLVDNARGVALGVTAAPSIEISAGVLEPGEALMFYTDGLVEARSHDIADGIEQLRRIARDAVRPGFAGAANRILAGLPRGEDDRAVLMLLRGVGD